MKDLATPKERAVLVLLTAQAGKEGELLQFLEDLAGRQDRIPGCTRSILARSIHETSTFVWSSVWRDGVALSKFMTSETFRVLLGASSVLSTPAQFRFIADETPESSEVTNRIRGLAQTWSETAEPFAGPPLD